MNLVELVDDMLVKFDDGRLQKFFLDGQSVVLEDVCEVRPDFAPRLKKYLESGKLNAGPWYTMPDEFLSSGESLIRNFLYGRETVRSFGAAAWKTAYACDIFGHIAQFPQIIDGFGMKTAVVGRGISGAQFLKWEAPDGTRVNLVAYGDKGYGGFGRDMHGFAYAGKTPRLTKEQYAKRFAKYLKKYSAITPDTMLLPDADDHSRIADNCDEEIAWIKELCPKSEFVQTDYVDLPEFDAPKLRVKKGELAETADDKGHGAMKLVQNSISSRYDIKRFNDETQNLLEWQIEPMLASRVFFGHADKTKKSLLDMSWKTLLKNQAHDSICGCSVDEIHYVMKPRYIEIRQIADGIADDLLSRPKNGVKLRRAPEGKFDKYKIDVYNPLPYSRDETLKLRIPLSLGFPKQFREPRAQETFAAFEIFDKNGRKLPHAVLKVEKNQLVRYDGIVDFYTIAVKAELAPSAITTLELRAADFPPRGQDTMRNSMLSADNGRLALSVNKDGTFDVSEKSTGKTVRGFNRFVFDRDAGDGWYYVPPQGNSALLTPDAARVRVITDTAFLLEYEITQTFKMPKRLEYVATPNAKYSGTEDSEELAEISVKTVVSLERDAQTIRAKTGIDNTASDFRMRLAVPTNAGGDYFAGQSFTMIKRAAGIDESTLKKAEAKAATNNFNGIAGRGGVFFLSKGGLHEVACEKFAETDILITLLRSFRRTYTTNGERDGMMLGKSSFEYAYSFGTNDFAEIYRRAQKLGAEIKYASAPAADGLGETDLAKAFLKAEGDCVVSAVKPSQDGSKIVVRVFNPNPENTAKCSLEFAAPAAEISKCRIDETPIATLAKNSAELSFTVAPNKITTLLITPAK